MLLFFLSTVSSLVFGSRDSVLFQKMFNSLYREIMDYWISGKFHQQQGKSVFNSFKNCTEQDQSS